MIGIGGYNQLVVHRKAFSASVIGVTTGSNTQSISAPDTHRNVAKEKRRGTIWKKIWRDSYGSKNNAHAVNSIFSSFSKSTKLNL